MPFSQGHHFICLIHFGMLVFTALVNTRRGWSLNVLKACKIENLDLFGSRVLLLKGILCFALKFAFFSKYGRAELAKVLLMRKNKKTNFLPKLYYYKLFLL